MKAAAFDYAKPATLEEAFALLAKPNAKVLAGGQSLIPSLNMRLSAPDLLVDISGLDLKQIELKGQVLRIGALVTHTELLNSKTVEKHVPLLAQAVPHVAHAAIRNRGTIGGSLVLADPAAEYPAVALALEAVLVVQSKTAERRVEAAKFFKGLFDTDLRPGELLTAVEFPAVKPADKCAFLELTRRHGDYAIVGLARHNERFVYFGVGGKPELFSFKDLKAAKEELTKNLNPSADLYNSAKAKLHLAGVLLERAWNATSH